MESTTRSRLTAQAIENITNILIAHDLDPEGLLAQALAYRKDPQIRLLFILQAIEKILGNLPPAPSPLAKVKKIPISTVKGTPNGSS